VNRNGLRKFVMPALLLVSLFMYGCSPSANPQTEMNVLVLDPETQVEAPEEAALPEAIVPESLEEAAPQAKLAFQDSTTDQEEAAAQVVPAQTEPAEGLGAGAPAAESFTQAVSTPTQESIPESIPEETVPAPQVQQSVSSGEPTVGSQAPEFNLPTLDGQSLQLSALRGKNVLISYWVTWCIPCMEELPALNRIYQEYQEQNLVILSVNGIKQDEMDKVAATVSELGISMPVVFDQDDALWNSYWVRFLPTSFFIDENGVIRHIQLGSLTEDEFRTKIDQLISDQL
jgi:peroxiredoxin